MNRINLNLLVQNVSGQFNIRGGVTPVIRVFPPLCLPDRPPISQLVLPKEAIQDLSLAPQDVLRITIDEKNKVTPKVVTSSERTKVALHFKNCPVCSEPLLPPIDEMSVGRCLNIACGAQIPNNVLTIAKALDIPYTERMRRVFDSILSRGLLLSPDCLWSLDIQDLITPVISGVEAREFIHQIHAVRGKCTLQMALEALCIRDLEDEHLEILGEVCMPLYDQEKSIGVVSKLLHKDTRPIEKDKKKNKILQQAYKIMDTFLSVGDNAAFCESLLLYLRA